MLNKLQQVFDRFRAADLRMHPEKCVFLQRKSSFLDMF
jgi:hypothetical protein